MADGYVTYDGEADVLYVHLGDGEVARTVPVDDLRLIDYDTEGKVLGVEFVCASDGVELADIPFARTVERLIGLSGFEFKVFA